MEAATPLEHAPPALAGGRRLLLKREDRHELGAFKWRGALPTLAAYRDHGAATVVTASTGNHGAATAWAAQRTGLRALVFVPDKASRPKLRLIEELGAEVRHAGADVDEAKDAARAYARESGLPFFEDGAEDMQFEGYTAIGREIVEQLGERPALTVVPVGNGALLVGVARGLAEGAGSPHAHGAVGVVSKAAPVMALSVRAGRPVECDRMGTFADGMAVRVAVPLAVKELVRLGTPLVEVSERAIARAVGAFAETGLRVEGSAAAALAALDALDAPDGPVVLVVTGRNIDEQLHRRAVERPETFPD
ncbi:MAG TPA: PLP-dependent lyase/thiolase [Thermoleophilaceae bacterium]|nr:PLP-dependent lyase/thiolase [Thermoleophilaceae bacterium]